MSWEEVKPALEELCGDIHELAAPAGVTRAIVWNRFGRSRICGDNQTVAAADRIQLDLYWQRSGDTLQEDVYALLNYYQVPYEEQDTAYDDDAAMMRCILQLWVL